jgi:flagellar FliJ protein
MSNPFPLKPVMDLARESADVATQRLGHAMKRLMDADRKLKMLLDYREEYQNKFRDSVSNGIDSAGMRNFNLFLEKLEGGIEAARAQADAARRATTEAQTEWQTQQRKLKAYDVLAERHEKLEATREARREQRETDDQAAASYRQGLLTQRLR